MNGRLGKYFLDENGVSTFTLEKKQSQSARTKTIRLFLLDQYNAEFNRELSSYERKRIRQLLHAVAQNIRKYKGVRSIPC